MIPQSLLRSLLKLLPGAAALLVISVACAQQGAPASPLLAPVDDAAIRKQFDTELTALMEAGLTTATDQLLEGLKVKKVPAGIELADARHTDEPLSEAQSFQGAREASLVLGRVFQCDKCDRWHGRHSGAVLIDPSGIAVTNYHVMDNQDSGAFGAMDVEGRIYPVTEILAASKNDDLAIVRLGKGEREGDFPFIPLAKGDPPGSEIRVISHPSGHFYSVSEGIISRYFLHRSNRAERLQITADFARGSSGCGVFNTKGELTGIVIATDSLYYDEDDGVQKNLQMVIKSCAPVSSVRALFD